MSDADFNVKGAIMEQIAKTSDENMRTVLLLLLGVLEHIGSKIDNFSRDETTIKTLVLNGHVDNHHSDHDWIREHKAQDAVTKALIERAVPALEWYEAQQELAKNNRSSFRKIAESLITQAVLSLVSAFGIVAAILWAMK